MFCFLNLRSVIVSGPLGFRSLRALGTPGLYSFKLRMRRGAGQEDKGKQSGLEEDKIKETRIEEARMKGDRIEEKKMEEDRLEEDTRIKVEGGDNSKKFDFRHAHLQGVSQDIN